MKIDPCLFNFISPVTGRILCDEDYVLIGNSDGIAVPSIALPIGTLPDLPHQNLWIGNSSNRPVAKPTIEVDNLPDLFFEATWVGDLSGRPVATLPSPTAIDFASYVFRSSINPGFPATSYPRAQFLDLLGFGGMAKIVPGGTSGSSFAIAQSGVDYISPTEFDEAIEIIEDQFEVLEDEIGALEAEIISVAADLTAFEAAVELQFLGVEAEFLVVEIELEFLEDEIAGLAADVGILDATVTILVGNVAALDADIIDLRFDLDNLELQNIPAGGDVSLDGFKIINLDDPDNDNDAANKIYVDNAVANGGTSLTIDGFVVGGPPVAGVITTVRGPTCLLTNIPAGGDVDMDNNRITNLQQSPEGDFDAVSFKFLWDLMHDQVEILWP